MVKKITTTETTTEYNEDGSIVKMKTIVTEEEIHDCQNPYGYPHFGEVLCSSDSATTNSATTLS